MFVLCILANNLRVIAGNVLKRTESALKIILNPKTSWNPLACHSYPQDYNILSSHATVA